MAFSPIYAIKDRHGRSTLLPYKQGVDDGSTLTFDFTTGVLDPRLTFTRGSNATFINSQGYVQYADANLLQQSESFSGAPWGAAGTIQIASATTTNPIGGDTAISATMTATTSSAGINALTSSSIGIPYVFRVWVKGNTTNKISIGVLSSSSWLTNVTITAVNGFLGVTISGSTYRNVTNLSTTEWTQLEMKYTAATTNADYIYLYPATVSPQTIGDSLYLWGAQLNPGFTASPYYKTTSTAYQAPRFDYAPDTRAPRGLLVEGEVVNRVTNSDTLPTGTSWTANSITRTDVSTVTPDGNTTTTTCGLSHTGSGSFRSAAVTVSANTAYTFSFWVKNNGGSVALYRAYNVSGSADIVSETSYFSQINSSTWTRIQFTFTTPLGCTSVYVYPLSQSSGTSNILVWGAQLEAGIGVSSYIPTGVSTATRNADKMSLLDITPMQWNQTAGTFALSMDVAAETNTTSFPAAWGMYTASAPPVRVIRNLINNSNGTNPRLFVDTWTSAPTQIFSQSISRPASPALTKFAFALSNSGQEIAMCVNNGAITTGSGTGTMQTPTRLLFHRDPSADDTEYFPIHIRSFKYWPTSLSNAQLQSLTT